MRPEDGYSLWIEPRGAARERLAQEVVHLADQHPGAPKFPPHVTLLGLIQQPEGQVLETAQKLASQLKPYTIRFQDVQRGTFYYQCVFLRAHDDPDTMQAAMLARQLYGMESKPYMPHLSLLYADMTDDEKEQVMVPTRQRLFGPDQAFDQLGGAEFLAGSVSVWYTPTDDKTTTTWKLVAEYPLQG